jgi:polyhydroxyalkanoate synthesis repressor PhaR
MSAEPIEIRRYPNRRLYDRSRRRYVTLQEIEQLVREGHTVVVRDSRTGEDLTRSILTQLLLERHPEKMEMFPVAMLHAILRANDLALEFLRGSLRQSLASLEALQKTPPSVVNPLDWMSALLPVWPPSPAAARDEVLTRRIAELEDRLARLEGHGSPEIAEKASVASTEHPREPASRRSPGAASKKPSSGP